MSSQTMLNNDNIYRNILFQCPLCQEREKIRIPTKIINESKQLTIISIPSGLFCSHSFQVFIDKNFKVRGY